MKSLLRILLGLTLVGGMAMSARAQSLVVETNTLEAGAASYTFVEITNGATYTLSGPGAQLNMGTGGFFVGTNSGARHGSLIVTNGAVFNQTSGSFSVISDSSRSRTSMVMVSGAAFTNSASMTILAKEGAHRVIFNEGSKVQLAGVEMSSGNGSFEISGGARVLSSGRFRLSYGGTTEYTEMLVKGPGTALFVTNIAGDVNDRGIQLGGYGSAKLTVADGALITNRQGASFGVRGSSPYPVGSMTGWLSVVSGGVFSNGVTGGRGICFGNVESGFEGGVGIGLVSGAGSVLHTTSSLIVSGSTNAFGQFVYRSALVVSNGGFAGANGDVYVGIGDVLVTGGGTLEAAGAIRMNAGYTGTLSNLNGGILQFSTANPTIATNDRQILVSDSVISFRNRGDAPVAMTAGLSNMTYRGANALQFYNSSNASIAAYTFSTNLGAYNWAGLRLAGATSGWRSSSVWFDPTASLLVTNTVAAFSGVMTNDGVTRVVNSRVVFHGPVVLSGAYLSDPSTNTFNSNLTVTASGSLSGSNGDLFVFNRDFINASTNAASFDLAHAAVLFTNGTGVTAHHLILSNSGSVNIGQGFQSFAQVATNFALGQLGVAAGNRLAISGNKDSLTNALYVGWLDLQGINTNSYDAVTNALFAALNLPDINVYYDKYDARNGWLNANLINDSATGYNLWGGGWLMPIPEPSMFAALAVGLGLIVLSRRRRR